MKSFCESWFKQFKPNTDTKKGTLNKVPAGIAFANEIFVLEVYEVGMLWHKEFPYVAVLLDGIARFMFNNICQVGCVEIKLCVVLNMQLLDPDAVAVHGTHVQCTFNNAAFKKCVPLEHRTQVIHQAFVCGFKVGVYVVSNCVQAPPPGPHL
eukprot:7821371-Ditylum_brightwellii.AAC.2